MKKLFLITIIMYGMFSCATVKLYDAPVHKKSKNEIGVEYYNSKPFLLVEKNPAKDVAQKASIIYLPDLSNPRYAKFKQGLGSADLKIALENGMLTSYGLLTDSKIPETITAVTGLAGLVLGKPAEAAETGEESSDVSGLIDASEILGEVITAINNLALNSTLNAAQKKNLDEIASNLNTTHLTLSVASASDLDRVISSLELEKGKLDVSKNSIDVVERTIEKIKNEIENTINLLINAKRPASKRSQSMQEASDILADVITTVITFKTQSLLTSGQKKLVGLIETSLVHQKSELLSKDIFKIDAIVDAITAEMKNVNQLITGNSTDPGKTHDAMVERTNKELQSVVDKLQPSKKSSDPSFELYEIDITGRKLNRIL